ncbi:MAG: 2-hydroxyacid dehydrogenase [SAR324 cluster bacterium]|uniref:2-hydroxyacid dehydrogenase n=1 Tax=SAR324 cluster bacterium TaxID=2024889 RepID=A0A7X9IJL1_9DELT|nr:2-hydroxyacid dehydrogenase [SAR324 cluster bacterium]
MKIAMFSTQRYEKGIFSDLSSSYGHEIKFQKATLSQETALLALGFPAICVFVHDELTADVLTELKEGGTRIVALRCAGFNNVNIESARDLGITVVRVPAYSPHAIAEHALALILCANRKIHRAYARVREGNFSLDGLQGFDLYKKTAGIIGTGKIGAVLAQTLCAIGCKVLAYDKFENAECKKAGVEYVDLEELYARSDIISLHCPLLPDTRYMINEAAISRMKTGVMLINTSRGALVDTKAGIEGLKSGKIGYLGLDVYEEEESLFFKDLSNTVIQDDLFARLLTFPNVIITSHQGFLTNEALLEIAHCTLKNIATLERGENCENVL